MEETDFILSDYTVVLAMKFTVSYKLIKHSTVRLWKLYKELLQPDLLSLLEALVIMSRKWCIYVDLRKRRRELHSRSNSSVKSPKRVKYPTHSFCS